MTAHSCGAEGGVDVVVVVALMVSFVGVGRRGDGVVSGKRIDRIECVLCVCGVDELFYCTF